MQVSGLQAIQEQTASEHIASARIARHWHSRGTRKVMRAMRLSHAHQMQLERERSWAQWSQASRSEAREPEEDEAAKEEREKEAVRPNRDSCFAISSVSLL